MIGGISVSVTTGLGAAIVTTVSGDNQVRLMLLEFFGSNLAHQFKHWFIYVLIVVVVSTLGSFPSVHSFMIKAHGSIVAEVYYLNRALALFNTGVFIYSFMGI
jgi:hypothetical protein